VPTQRRSGSVTVWHGTSDEMWRLSAAVRHYCACAVGAAGATTVCPAHTMLFDQRILDHLLYVFRTRSFYKRAEWMDDQGEPRVRARTDWLSVRDYAGD
jgi:hypothetical protein